MRGGIAPTIAPTQVLTGCILFKYVYAPAYIAMLAAPRSEVVGLTPYHKSPVPTIPVAIAKMSALRLLSRPRTSGRFFVLLILASCCGSNSIFNVLADAICRNVPLVRNSSVRVLSEGASVTDVLSKAGTGYMEYDAVVVRTTRKARRGLDKER